jgi:hypothetical protein
MSKPPGSPDYDGQIRRYDGDDWMGVGETWKRIGEGVRRPSGGAAMLKRAQVDALQRAAGKRRRKQ